MALSPNRAQKFDKSRLPNGFFFITEVRIFEGRRTCWRAVRLAFCPRRWDRTSTSRSCTSESSTPARHRPPATANCTSRPNSPRKGVLTVGGAPLWGIHVYCRRLHRHGLPGHEVVARLARGHPRLRRTLRPWPLLRSIAGCDKSLLGLMMAMLRLNVLRAFMYGGSILLGCYQPTSHNPQLRTPFLMQYVLCDDLEPTLMARGIRSRRLSWPRHNLSLRPL